MFAGILLHIIKLKMMYSHESHHYGGCNQSLTSRTSPKPISRKVKPAIPNYKVPIKSVKNFFLDLEINFTVNNNINVSMSPATAFIFNFQSEFVY